MCGYPQGLSFLKEILKREETSVLTDEELLCGPAHRLPWSSNLLPIQLLDWLQLFPYECGVVVYDLYTQTVVTCGCIYGEHLKFNNSYVIRLIECRNMW